MYHTYMITINTRIKRKRYKGHNSNSSSYPVLPLPQSPVE